MTILSKLTRYIAAALLLGTIYAPASAQDYFISNAKLVTNGSDNIVEDADIVIRSGKIVQIGSNLVAPADATLVKADGKWVTPGIIAPFSQLGLVDIGAEDATNDISSEDSDTSVSELASDSFNPKAASIANTRRSGITHAIISPRAAGDSIFGGTGLTANLSGDYQSIETAQAFIYVQLGAQGTSRSGGSRAAAFQQLRAALDDAAAYPSKFKSPDDGDALSRQDAGALFKAARGGMPLIIAADRASEILNIIKLKKDYGKLDIIILGAAEAWKVAPQIADAKIKVMVDPHENLPASFDKVEARLDNVVLLDAAGVDYVITNHGALGVSKPVTLTQHAGNAVGNGLSWDKAFAAITATPAKWFDIGNVDLRPGSVASLVIWDGDPLNVTSAPIMMMIDGKTQSLKSRQTALRDRYNPLSDDERPHKYR